jgi:hypothetical protein
MRPVPVLGIKRRLASFVGDDKIVAGLKALMNAMPTLEFRISKPTTIE